MTNPQKNSIFKRRVYFKRGEIKIEGWGYKDIPSFYNRVRLLLNNLSSVSLPDEYIDMPERAPFAESYVKDKIPNWMELTGKELEMAQIAIVYKTASFFETLATSGAIKKKELPTIKLEYFATGPISFSGKSLSVMADDMIASINGVQEDSFIGFLVT